MLRISLLLLLALMITACDGILPESPTLTPTRNSSAPAIVASPTVQILDSQQLYGDSQLGGANNATAASLPSSASLPPLGSGTQTSAGAETVQIVLASGQVILGDFYIQHNQASRMPAVLIIGQNRAAWGTLPNELFSRGMNVLVVEMPSTVIADMDVLLTSLSENGAVDPSRIATIGELQYADMALLACAVYPICDYAILLSPTSRDTLLNVLPNYNPRPIFVVAAENDPETYTTALALVNAYANGSQWLSLAAGRGANMLALNSGLGDAIGDWLVLQFQSN